MFAQALHPIPPVQPASIHIAQVASHRNSHFLSSRRVPRPQLYFLGVAFAVPVFFPKRASRATAALARAASFLAFLDLAFSTRPFCIAAFAAALTAIADDVVGFGGVVFDVLYSDGGARKVDGIWKNLIFLDGSDNFWMKKKGNLRARKVGLIQ
ncbi:hypothetical protein BDZ45DRAFT_197673 [Acephala macrosclerotiorum]|nr:hypothetical protein BDZ45DRAFT_197673 [Acephala macrosclerotiorum]